MYNSSTSSYGECTILQLDSYRECTNSSARFIRGIYNSSTSSYGECTILHKASLLGNKGIRGNCFRSIPGRDHCLSLPQTSRNKTATSLSFRVCCLSQDIGYIRSHYNIEDFVYYDYHRPEEHGRLHHCVLNPAFTPHTKHFIKVCSHCLSYVLCLHKNTDSSS